MKCPKCSFISFDYNDICPKCGIDLSHERNLMNFSAYKPAPLSLLGVLTGDQELPGGDAFEGQSETPDAHGSETQELLISLDSLSEEAQSPIHSGPKPSLTGPEPTVEEETGTTDEEFTISLDDLSDEDQAPAPFEPRASLTGSEMEFEKGGEMPDEEAAISLDDLSDQAPELALFDEETEVSRPEAEIPGEGLLDPETTPSESAGPEKEDFWETEAIEQRMADIQLDDIPEKEIPDAETKPAGEGNETEPDLFELELEPLKLDLEMESSDKKTP